MSHTITKKSIDLAGAFKRKSFIDKDAGRAVTRQTVHRAGDVEPEVRHQDQGRCRPDTHGALRSTLSGAGICARVAGRARRASTLTRCAQAVALAATEGREVVVEQCAGRACCAGYARGT